MTARHRMPCAESATARRMRDAAYAIGMLSVSALILVLADCYGRSR